MLLVSLSYGKPELLLAAGKTLGGKAKKREGVLKPASTEKIGTKIGPPASHRGVCTVLKQHCAFRHMLDLTWTCV